jgi:hypothetical protein
MSLSTARALRVLASMTLTAALAAPASAVVWNGTGSPASVGAVFTSSGPGQSTFFALDSMIQAGTGNNAGTAVSTPGVMAQFYETDNFGRWNLDNAGLLNSTGWSASARVWLPNENTGDTNAHGGVFEVSDGDKRIWVLLHNDDVALADAGEAYPGIPGSRKITVDMNDGYHSLRLSRGAGSSTVTLSLLADDNTTVLSSVSFTPSTDSGAQTMRWGDNGGMRNVNWDSIAINESLPTPAAAVISVNTPVSDTVIKGGVANLGINVRNLGEAGGVNLNTTLIDVEDLAGTTYSADPLTNVVGAIPQGPSHVRPFTATTTAGTPAGAHTLNLAINGNAGNSPFNSADIDSPVLTVLEHSNASFDVSTDDNTLTVDLGDVVQGSGGGFASMPFDVFNFEASPGFTAAMNLLSSNVAAVSGDTDDLFPVSLDTNNDPVFPPEFTGVAGSSSETLQAVVDTTLPLGSYSATWTLLMSDHTQFDGATDNATALTLTIVANIVPVPEPASVLAMSAGAVLLVARRRR